MDLRHKYGVYGDVRGVNGNIRGVRGHIHPPQIRGVYGNIFVDLGPEFVVSDVNGENPAQAMVSHISQVAPPSPRPPRPAAAAHERGGGNGENPAQAMVSHISQVAARRRRA